LQSPPNPAIVRLDWHFLTLDAIIGLMSKARLPLFALTIIVVLFLLWLGRSHLGFGDPTSHGGSVQPWSEVSKDADKSAGSGDYQRGEVLGTITDRRLSEISGITASRRADDVWWIHNDSGDVPRIFAINSTGKVLGEYRVVGAVNEDWEDIASGPAADLSPALYIADIGDNYLKRDSWSSIGLRNRI
jgi:hypothetical protein